MEQFQCEFCKELFTPKRTWSKFCSEKCRNNFHNDKKLVGTILPIIKCPYCTSTNQDMIELIPNHYSKENRYLCSTCSREFVIEKKEVKS